MYTKMFLASKKAEVDHDEVHKIADNLSAVLKLQFPLFCGLSITQDKISGGYNVVAYENTNDSKELESSEGKPILLNNNQKNSLKKSNKSLTFFDKSDNKMVQ